MSHFKLFKDDPNAKAFTAGDIIFSEGDVGSLMYIVQTGKVDILLQDQVFDALGEGEALGEMALIHPGAPRSASAIARTDCHLVEIDQRRFTFLVQETPYFAIEIMKTLAERLARMNIKVESGSIRFS